MPRILPERNSRFHRYTRSVSIASSLSRLAPEFVHAIEPRGAIAWRADLAAQLRAAGFDLDERPFRASDLHGRRPLGELSIGGERFVVRRYRHGGLLRWLTGERFLEAERPFRELELAREAARLGIATPELVAARALAAVGGGWKLDLVSRRVENAFDLGRLCLDRVRGELDERSWRAAWRATGELVRRLHARGFLHADLTPRNLLVERASLEHSAPALWVVDLDRSVIRPSLARDERLANLRRLYRHLERLQRDGRAHFCVRDVARFLAAYESVRAERHAIWRAIAARHARARAVHSAGWAVERSLGARRSDAR